MHAKSLYKLIKVIKLESKDLKHCMQLDKETFGGIWSFNQWKKELADPARICLGVVKDTKVIGLACGSFALEEINITLIAVSPLYQNLGIGKLILKSLISEGRRNGAKSATLEVKDNNLAGKSIYEGLNFKKVGSRKNFYTDGSTAIIYKRTTD